MDAEKPVVEPVKYFWREWYTRATYPSGRISHWGPWNSLWAAEHAAKLLRERL